MIVTIHLSIYDKIELIFALGPLLTINKRLISSNYPPYIISEISGNHLQSLDRCFDLVRESAEAGASAVKLQTINPSEITIDTDDPRFIVNAGPWKGLKLADIYRDTALPLEWHSKIFDYASQLGIHCFSSPFDVNSVNFLEKLDVPAYKIASNEILDWKLLEVVSKTKKPLIISTGTATLQHISNTTKFLKKINTDQFALLYCVSAYPPKYEDINLQTIADMRERFDCTVGLSDHCLSNEIAIGSIAFGASIIEKHLTILRSDGGHDSHFSLQPSELNSLVLSCNNVWKSLNSGIRYPGEQNLNENGIFVRKLWARTNISKGDEFTWNNVISIRAPSTVPAINSYEYLDLIGKISPVNIPMHEPINPTILNCKIQETG